MDKLFIKVDRIIHRSGPQLDALLVIILLADHRLQPVTYCRS